MKNGATNAYGENLRSHRVRRVLQVIGPGLVSAPGGAITAMPACLQSWPWGLFSGDCVPKSVRRSGASGPGGAPARWLRTGPEPYGSVSTVVAQLPTADGMSFVISWFQAASGDCDPVSTLVMAVEMAFFTSPSWRPRIAGCSLAAESPKILPIG